ncbi:outer membrane beta-barrel protein [Halomonas sp. CKK8]|uniref:outer membrane beta-barrel protein n=1 Tax=Halomonas sp. CKK8 TaxID=3036127 RepID=UPI0024151749|nr:outer membrane beta-barrel protein [Halomonas sp. CKK8]WFM71357.1 outer membrane beta-barrel protein [Halomonas sp. CKK8]
MKAIYTIPAAMLLAGSSTAVLAAPQFYLGAQAGYQDTAVEVSGSDTYSDDVETNSFSFKQDSYDASGIAGSALAGVKFDVGSNAFVSLEANIGTSNAEAEFSDSSSYSYDEGEFSGSGSRSSFQRFESGKTYGIAALAGLEVTPSTSVYARLGYQRTEFEYSRGWSSSSEYSDPWGSGSSSDGDSYSEDESFGGIRYGVGMETAIGERVAVRLDWSQTDYSSEDFDVYDQTIEIDPTESLFQAGVVYKF